MNKEQEDTLVAVIKAEAFITHERAMAVCEIIEDIFGPEYSRKNPDMVVSLIRLMSEANVPPVVVKRP